MWVDIVKMKGTNFREAYLSIPLKQKGSAIKPIPRGQELAQTADKAVGPQDWS